MLNILGALQYTEGEEIHSGVLYRLMGGLVLQGPVEFMTFGKCSVEGVLFEQGRYSFKTDQRLTISPNDDKSGVMVLSKQIRTVHVPGPELPPLDNMIDPVQEQFRQWAIDLGLIPPTTQYTLTEETDDEHEDDEHDEW